MKISKNQKRDRAVFYLEKGDPGFSPERNKAIVERSIKRYEAMRKKKKHEFDDAYMERADAVVTYLKAIDRGGISTRLDHFFTPNQIRKLQGRDIREKIMEGLKIVKTKRQLQGVL